jgi:hypothetical protein
LRQNLDKNQNLPPKNSLKKSSQKNPPKKILSKNFSQKIPPKQFRQKNSSKKIPPKNSSEKILQKNSLSHKKSKILKISNSLHRTWRPKTLSGLLLKKINLLILIITFLWKTRLTTTIKYILLTGANYLVLYFLNLCPIFKTPIYISFQNTKRNAFGTFIIAKK